MTPTSTRASMARERLGNLLAARPEYRRQLLDDWLRLATAAEVRKAWPRVSRAMNGLELPAWAIRADRVEWLAVGDRVEAGSGDDHDTGRILGIDGDEALIGWDSCIATIESLAHLRRIGA